MVNSTDTKSNGKAEREAEAKAGRRAEQAQIVAGLKTILTGDEQLLGFARGVIAGGVRGKLTVGLEAFFAPYVNIGLTERRLILQHIHAETGKPSEILPHEFLLGDIASITFSDIETFGGETACRLTLRQQNDHHFRLRLRGPDNVTAAQTLTEVFRSLVTSRPMARATPTQSVCPHCDHILDRPSKFCPYCGQKREESSIPDSTDETPDTAASAATPDTTSGPDTTSAAETGFTAGATAAATAEMDAVAETIHPPIDEANGVPSGETNFLFPGEMADAWPVPRPQTTEEESSENSPSIYAEPDMPAPSGLETISEAPSNVMEARLETPEAEMSSPASWNWLNGLRKPDSEAGDQGSMEDTPTIIDMPTEAYTETVASAATPPAVPPLPTTFSASPFSEQSGEEDADNVVETMTFLPPDHSATPSPSSETAIDMPTEGHEPGAQASEEVSEEEHAAEGEEESSSNTANEEGEDSQEASSAKDESTPPASQSQSQSQARQPDITAFGAEGPPADYGADWHNTPQGGH